MPGGNDREHTRMQLSAEEVIRQWPDVRPKQVFGARAFVRVRSMFAFLTAGGLAVKAPSPAELDELYGRPRVSPFTYNGMPMRGWPVLPLESDADLDDALRWARRAYEAAG